MGPSPSELFLAALGGCMMTNIATIAGKMNINLKSVRMEVSGIKEYNEHPSSFISLNVDVYIDAENADAKKLERLVELSEKYCTVSNTIRNSVLPKVSLKTFPP